METRAGTVVRSATVYLTRGNSNAESFGGAFAKGCNGRISLASRYVDGVGAGLVLPDIYPLFVRAKSLGHTFYYGDKAYFGRGHYFRVTKDAEQHDCSGNATPHRFERTRFQIKPWKTARNNFIFLCPQSETFFRLRGLSMAQWIEDVTKEIRKYTDREIFIHHKYGGTNAEQHFQLTLRNAYAVVVYSSMAGAQACLSGVPCFATNPTCASAKFGSTDLSKINSPIKPDNREQLAWNLADNQWTLEEIRKGIAWAHLCPQ